MRANSSLRAHQLGDVQFVIRSSFAAIPCARTPKVTFPNQIARPPRNRGSRLLKTSAVDKRSEHMIASMG